MFKFKFTAVFLLMLGAFVLTGCSDNGSSDDGSGGGTDNAAQELSIPLSPEHCIFNVEPSNSIQAGEIVTITIELKDKDGMDLFSETGQVFLKISPDKGEYTSLICRENGCTFKYRGQGAGLSTVSASYVEPGRIPVLIGEQLLMVNSGQASTENSIIDADPVLILSGQTSTITVTLFDEYNNRIHGPIEGLEITEDLSGQTIDIEYDEETGLYNGSFTPDITGIAVIQGKIDSVDLDDTAEINVPISPAQSAVIPQYPQLLADGSSTSVITVELKDSDGNLVPDNYGFEVMLYSEVPLLGGLGNLVYYDDDGVYRTVLTSAESAGSDTLTASIGGLPTSSAEVSYHNAGEARYDEETTNASGNIATVVLDSRPVPGNLLVAVSFQRTGWFEPNISGEGWILIQKNLTLLTDSGYRRGIVIWYKIADENEPVEISTWWLSGDETRHNMLIVQEFFGTYELEDFSSTDNGTSTTTSLLLPEVNSESSDLIMFGAFGARERASNISWEDVDMVENGYQSIFNHFWTTLQTVHRLENSPGSRGSAVSWTNAVHANATLQVFRRVSPQND